MHREHLQLEVGKRCDRCLDGRTSTDCGTSAVAVPVVKFTVTAASSDCPLTPVHVGAQPRAGIRCLLASGAAGTNTTGGWRSLAAGPQYGTVAAAEPEVDRGGRDTRRRHRLAEHDHHAALKRHIALPGRRIGPDDDRPPEWQPPRRACDRVPPGVGDCDLDRVPRLRCDRDRVEPPSTTARRSAAASPPAHDRLAPSWDRPRTRDTMWRCQRRLFRRRPFTRDDANPAGANCRNGFETDHA